MKKNQWIEMAALLLGTLAFLSSCQSEEMLNEKYRPAGAEITFGASTSYQNDEETRTIYSGEVLGVMSNRFERIDWENEDQMTIEYNQAAAAGTYVVTFTASDISPP